MADPYLEEQIQILLEAERAGVLTARALHERSEDSGRKDLMALVLEGERRSCRILGRTLLKMDLKGSPRIGDFVQKVMALSDPQDQLRLLVKGQEWVVRKVDQVLADHPPQDIAGPMVEIRRIHDIGIGACREYLGREGKTWT
jgi:hypothetical protein